MKERLDKILLSRGIVNSRELAKAYILEGKVFVAGRKITKPGTFVDDASEITLKSDVHPYVSRGGLKLESARKFYGIDVKNRIVMDVGSSTGGFTDCLLRMGAKKVYCVDVGYGQLDWKLRNDPRVVVLERTNVRYLDRIIREEKFRFRSKEYEDIINHNIDMATIDVSFISLKLVIPVVLEFLKKDGEILALVKPQFEAGKGEVGRGGIVRDEEKRIRSIELIKDFSEKLGLKSSDIFQCPIKGQKGNIEYFLYMRRQTYERRKNPDRH